MPSHQLLESTMDHMPAVRPDKALLTLHCRSTVQFTGLSLVTGLPCKNECFPTSNNAFAPASFPVPGSLHREDEASLDMCKAAR
ncbi:hypothetical protein M430DRAFT_184990 [Amorphotheca resinae ATCC 22711]|uniref:Uncharacterized protein n=1 Tax=Amorphotheca resinae ATCC 22711 TaxID=857342 RepID=A0A2T3ASG3_AMORE|nr:hypothetical protein M430DRAFT_184990 [Amorphotheca resinae ATCC 22711]PSS09272.1 hypothetical protein M430DRAFT_184990 [Amorphotheca resinae ATCC 22711]